MCISRRNRPEKKAGSEVEDVMFFDMDDDEAEGGFPGFFGGGGGGGLLNLLRGEMGGGSRRTNRKCPNTEYPLKVSLEDLYRGRVAKLKLTKKTPCTRCDGSGGAKGASYKCQSCRGHGRRMVLRRVGPMMAQTEAECEDCDGRGERIPAKELCPKCTGEGVTKEQKALQAEVERGMVDGDVIIFKGEGDQLKVSSEPGDVVVHLIVKDHDVFTRRGDHLIIEKEISLNEALCGFQMQLEHLDGRSLVLKSKPDSIRGILNGGMPRRKNPTTNGNLYVKFEVKFPEPHFLADEEKYKVLATALPKAKKQRPVPEDAEEVSLMEYDAKKYDRRGGQAYDEDDDDEEEAGGSGGRPGQCAQQ